MADFRLVAARQTVWDKEAWRQPAFLGLLIRTLEDMERNEDLSTETRAEVVALIKKLHAAGREPARA